MTLGCIKIPLIVSFRSLFSLKNSGTGFTVKIEIWSELMLNSLEFFLNYTLIERCCNFLILKTRFCMKKHNELKLVRGSEFQILTFRD